MKYPEITVANQAKSEDTQTISADQLKEMLDKGEKKADGIHFTKDGKEYVIQETTQPGETKLSNAEIVDRLKKDGNKNYELGADGEIYYTTPHKEKVKLDVTQNELLRRSLTYKVTLTTTEKGSVENESTRPEEESKAKMNAIRKALNNAVVKLGVEDPVKAELESAIANETLNPNGGTFEVKLKDGKTYTLTYTGAEVKVETKEATDSNVPGKKPEDITDVMDNNVTGTAYVTGSKITYLHGEKYETTGMGELGIGADFTTAPADAVPGSVTTDTSGRITSYKDTAGNIHSFEYDDNVALDDLKPEERTELDKAATKNGWDTEIKNATLTRVKWTVKSPDTETEKTTPIEMVRRLSCQRMSGAAMTVTMERLTLLTLNPTEQPIQG